MYLSSKQKKSIRAIARKYHLKMMIVFGSQISGKTHSGSDLDIAVLPDNNDASFKTYTGLLPMIEDEFSGYEIDLSFINRADPLLLSKIAANPFLLSGSHRELSKFKLYAFHRYEDFKPYFRLESLVNNRLLKRFQHAH